MNLLRRTAGLDAGESEAIVLSDDLKSDLLLMDEAKGRDAARQMGIKVMGTVGLLMASYQNGNLNADEIKTCIDILRPKAEIPCRLMS